MTVGFGMIGAGEMAHIHAVAIAEQAPGRARLVAVAGGTRAPAWPRSSAPRQSHRSRRCWPAPTSTQS